MSDRRNGSNRRHNQKNYQSTVNRRAANLAEKDVDDPTTKQLKDTIIRLGDGIHSMSLSKLLLSLAETLRDALMDDVVLDVVFKCVVAIPVKTSVYATLVSLLAIDQPEFANKIVNKFKAELVSSLSHHDIYGVKYLIRFASELQNCNFYNTAAFKPLLELIVKVIFQNSSNDPNDSNFIPQSISDYYCSIILSSLAINNKVSEYDDIMDKIRVYINSKRTSLSWITCWNESTGNVGEFYIEDTCHIDNDFIERQFRNTDQYLQQNPRPKLRTISHPWESPAIKSLLYGIDDSNTHTLQTSFSWLDSDIFTENVVADLFTFRRFVSDKNDARAEIGLSSKSHQEIVRPPNFILPRPNAHIFPTTRTHGSGEQPLTPLERWILEDYILDTVHVFRSTHTDIFEHLYFLTTLDFFDTQAFLCEVLLNNLLRFPSAAYPEVHYGTILLGFCQKVPEFVTVLGEAVQRIFGSLASISPPAIESFVTWFAHHLSNTELQWTWDIWAQYPQANPSLSMQTQDFTESPQLSFIRELVSSIVRLSYFERIEFILNESVPSCTPNWLPHKPEPNPPQESFLFHPFANSINSIISDRTSPASSLTDHLKAAQPLPITATETLQVIVRSIIQEGLPNITHLHATISKFKDVISQILKGNLEGFETLPDGGAHFILRAIFDFHLHNPQLIAISSLAMLQHGLLTESDITKFLLSSSILKEHGHRYFIWDLLAKAIRSATQRKEILETSIENSWIYECKVKPDIPAPEHAQRIQGLASYLETKPKIAACDPLLTELAQDLFKRFLDLISDASITANTRWHEYTKSYFLRFALRHSQLFLLYMPTLKPELPSYEFSIRRQLESIIHFAQNY